jgi:hypothetical protein
MDRVSTSDTSSPLSYTEGRVVTCGYEFYKKWQMNYLDEGNRVMQQLLNN